MITLLALTLAVAPPASAQEVRSLDRERARLILNNVHSELQKHYHDAGLNGVDLDARFKETEAKLGDANSLGQLFGFIALMVRRAGPGEGRQVFAVRVGLTAPTPRSGAVTEPSSA